MPVRVTPRGTRGSRFFNMPPLLKSVFTAVNLGMYRLMGRRMRIQGRPLLLLTTIGARTGKLRQTSLGWFEDDPHRSDAWLVVASAAGAASHPGWYMNLARRPDDVSIDIDGGHLAVSPQSLEGEERKRAWARIVALAPGYGQYAVTTDREIPVVRLTRRP